MSITLPDRKITIFSNLWYKSGYVLKNRCRVQKASPPKNGVNVFCNHFADNCGLRRYYPIISRYSIFFIHISIFLSQNFSLESTFWVFYRFLILCWIFIGLAYLGGLAPLVGEWFNDYIYDRGNPRNPKQSPPFQPMETPGDTLYSPD